MFLRIEFNLKLVLEWGRWVSVPDNHFLFDCPAYDDVARAEFTDKLGRIHFDLSDLMHFDAF